MMVETNRVIIHHEGDGAPTDDVDRPLHEAYSAAIGVTLYKMHRSPKASFITRGTHGPSLQIVLTGNRMIYPVTDHDITLIAQVCNDARRRQWLTLATALVTDHRTASAGAMATACPGTQTQRRMNEITYAINKRFNTTPPPVSWPFGGDVPKSTDIVDVLDTADGCWQLTADGGIRTVRGTFHGSYPMIPGEPPRLFYAISATVGRPGYTEWATDGAFYSWPDPRFPVG